MNMVAMLAAADLRGTVNLMDGAPLLRRFWENIGWCPPLPHSNMSDFFMQPASVLNHVELAGMPQQGIKQVRIHFLLALLHVPPRNVRMGSTGIAFDRVGQPWNFTELDTAMDLLRELGLQVGFELMGNPDGIFSDWRAPEQVSRWGDMVEVVVRRYMERYGLEWVRTWRFEPWNEPDHACSMTRKLDAGITCDLPSWLAMYAASSRAISEVSPLLQLGGPNTGGSTMTSPFFDALLASVNASHGGSAPLKLDFISWHEKGSVLNASSHTKVPITQHITDADIKIIKHIRAAFPRLAHVPQGNSEADPLGGWNKNLSWRGDARYAAMAVKVVAQRLEELVFNRSFPLLDLDISSNDAAFLNYADSTHRFSQRTLTATIAYNHSTPTVATAVLRKPVLNALGLLSFVKQRRHEVHWLGGPRVEEEQRAAVAHVGAIASR
jgi:L-iduronidase